MNGSGDMSALQTLLRALHEHEVFKLGDFVLKSGLKSPIYIDLRALISTPTMLRLAADCVCDIIRTNNIKYDYIVGVPYAALPIATLVCDRLNAPMLLRRKEAKKYGTKKLIEGQFEAGGRALIVEDVVTSGLSIKETTASLREVGLVCADVVCVLNREQGGMDKLKQDGVDLFSVLSMSTILDYMVGIGSINEARKQEIQLQLANPEPAVPKGIPDTVTNKNWSIASRNADNSLANRLFKIMNKKKTCLCLAVDHTKCDEVVKTVELAKDYVCCIKIHVDIIEDFNMEFVHKLTQMANAGDFVIFEDRKVADTGNTVELQITKGLYGIASWAHIITVHALPGQPILTAVKKVIQREGTALGGCLLIAELSTEGALTNSKEYLQGVTELAKANKDVVTGFICQKRCLDDPSFLYWTPGVNLDLTTDGAGQQWRSVEKAIKEQGNDIVVVGRAITNCADINTQLRRYRDAAWEALVSRNA